MNDPNVTADKVDDKTIQWARESLQRRRIELRGQKEKLIASYRAISSSSSNPSPETSNAAAQQRPMVDRGRALLAEAEARAEILRRYASFRDGVVVAASPPPPRDGGDASDRSPATATVRGTNSTIGRDDDDFSAAILARGTSRAGERPAGSRATRDSESTPNRPRAIAIDLPVESPYWECEYEEGDFPSSDDDEWNDGDDGMQTNLTEGEARERLDELIASLRRRGDDEMASEDTPRRRIASFDPSSMNAAKRAALRKTKLDEEVAAAEEEARLMTSFRALPLPGGAEVRNNIFASTRAFQGKQTGPVEKSARRDHVKCEQNDDASSSLSRTFDPCDGFSTATSRTGREDSFGASAFGNEADREREILLLAEKKMKKRQILGAINRIVMEEMQPASIEEDGGAVPDEGFDVVEDPSKLLQDIAQLKAKLKQKKTQRLAVLNDIVDIDLNAPFDRLLSGDAGVEMRCIIDRLKERVCGVNVVDDYQIFHAVGKRVDESHIRAPQRGSVFVRQLEWAKQREQKLFTARLQQEANAMDGITGMPQVSHTTQSWKRARDSHDETLRRVAEEESMKRQHREAKEKALAELKDKEIEELQKQANAKVKSMKTEVDKEEQMKRIESLSRPRQTREVLANVEPCADNVEEHQQPCLTSKSKVYLSPKPQKKTNASKGGRSESEDKAMDYSNSTYDVTPAEFCGKSSFAEMSDKEFAKLIKTIGKNASSRAKE